MFVNSQDFFPPRSIWSLRRLPLGRTRARVLRPQAQVSQVNIQKPDSLHVPIKIQCFVGARKLKLSYQWCVWAMGHDVPWLIRAQLILVQRSTACCRASNQALRSSHWKITVFNCQSDLTVYYAGGLLQWIQFSKILWR
jgi:hypothetical protein